MCGNTKTKFNDIIYELWLQCLEFYGYGVRKSTEGVTPNVNQFKILK